LVVLAFAATLAGAPARADGETGEAKVHFARGVTLYRETDYRSALIEFRRAHELSGNWGLLYNIAQAEYQTLDYAGALRSFQRYLAEGGDKIARARKDEVEQEIARLAVRVAKVTVVTKIAGATVTVDEAPVGATPLPEPLVVALGPHRITVAKEGRVTWRSTIAPAGGDAIELRPVLEPLATSPLPPPPPPPVPPARSVPWIGWGVTGAFAAGAITTGIFALDASARLDSTRGRFDATDADLDSAATRVKVFSILSDVCTAGALISGGVSLYLTLKPPPRELRARGDLRVSGVSAGPRGIFASGSF
jgi:hypothetical protein